MGTRKEVYEKTRTIVELDLMGYSDIVRLLEQNLSVRATMTLNEQIQGLVDEGLRAVNISRDEAVNGEHGDNAIVVFERVSDAHRFAEEFHRVTERYNSNKNEESAKRWFRLGISTGPIAIKGNKISGTAIIDACRLEAGGDKGDILIDKASYDELPGRFQNLYKGPESIKDKRGKQHQVYRILW